MTSPEPPIRLDATTTELSPDSDAWRRRFAATHALICPGLFGPAMVGRLNRLSDAGRFEPDTMVDLGSRRVECPAAASTAIALLLRRPSLFRWLEAVTGCDPLRTVEGRVVETLPEPGSGLRWHDDLGDARRLAITIALGCAPYEGGGFELRSHPAKTPLLSFRHDRPGTALIFAVRADHEHRVLPVVSGGPRRVFAGWFLG